LHELEESSDNSSQFAQFAAKKVKMRLREYTAAGGVVLDHSGRVLLIERWLERGGEVIHEVRLPKGHVDPGESDEEAARRETCEESGYCALEVIADLGTSVTEFDKPLGEDEREHVRRTERFFLMRLTDERRGEPNFQTPDEARFRPRWAVNLAEAERLLTYASEKDFAGRARGPAQAWAPDMPSTPPATGTRGS
jgi:8-oxo-dGTP pyrophosphatase MutT (NUDIX family)